MSELYEILAILLASSVLNIVTWLIIIGRVYQKFDDSVKSVKDLVETVKG